MGCNSSFSRPFDRFLRNPAEMLLESVQHHERCRALARVMRNQFVIRFKICWNGETHFNFLTQRRRKCGVAPASRGCFGRRARNFANADAVVHPINVIVRLRSNSAGRQIEPAGAGATHSPRKIYLHFLISLHLRDEIFHRSHSPSRNRASRVLR